MTTHTTIYLDVDGVLNAVGPNRDRAAKSGWLGEWGSKKVNQWPIQYSMELIEKLNELSTVDGVTIKWLTTWTDDAAKILSPALGIDGEHWPVIGRDESDGEWGWWKLKALREDAAATSPDQIIWIDDDLRSEKAALWWALEAGNVTAISPEMHLGITAAEFSKILEASGVDA